MLSPRQAALLAQLPREQLEALAAEQAELLGLIRQAADTLGTARLSRFRAELVEFIAQSAAGHHSAAAARAAWEAIA
jgi:hypothetical protein